MPTVVRFAPSPTGYLHVGNARTLVMNQIIARQADDATFLLRIDDTDAERSKPEYEAAIEDDLVWMGCRVDQRARQSERLAAYDAAVVTLKEKGLLYPCYETGEELERKRKLQRARGLPPVYDRAALELSDADKRALEVEGRRPHWRFKLSGGRIVWDDRVRGETGIETTSLSDPILVREDGSYLYTLPSVVDAIEFGVTLIIRGEDHTTNSGAQIEIFEALGAEAPGLAHTPLLVGADGDKLSKRIGSLSLRDLRAQGIEPMALASLLAKIGTSDPVEARGSWDALAAEFSFDKIGRAPARFDEQELARLNAALVHETPYDAVADRLAKAGVGGGAAFWDAVKANLERVEDAAEWWSVVEGPLDPVIEDDAVTNAAAAHVPDDAGADGAWSTLVDAVKAATGAKGKKLFMPLRLALTGRAHGPDMATMFALIGADKARARFEGKRA